MKEEVEGKERDKEKRDRKQGWGRQKGIYS